MAPSEPVAVVRKKLERYLGGSFQDDDVDEDALRAIVNLLEDKEEVSRARARGGASANDRCFVIAPIGPEGSDVRKHSDAVFRFIIEPAMKRCGLKALRSDQLAQPGKISDQMFEEILNDRLCIAVLTGHNPNVFYELAIAQAAARPVILLIETGEELPFDVKDLRSVYYDLWPEPLVDGVYAQKVVEQLLELEGAGWLARIPFGVGLEPLGGPRDGEFRFFEQSEAYGKGKDWLKLLEETKNVFEIMGINLLRWRGTRGFSTSLAEKAEGGCKARVLLIHEDNPCLPSLINSAAEEDAEASFDRIRDEIVKARDFYSGLAGKQENIEVRQIRDGCPHYQLARTDRYAMLVPYLYSERTQFSPLWRCPAGHPLYSLVEQEFASLWQVNEPARRVRQGTTARRRIRA